MMLDSVSHNTFLPNTMLCESLMSWSELFGAPEENYPPFDHLTGGYIGASLTSTQHSNCQLLLLLNNLNCTATTTKHPLPK